MTDKIYIAFCLIAALFFTAVTMPAFAMGGAGGSWDCPDGFQPAEGGGCKGAGGSTGGSGGGGSWGNSDGFGGSGGSGGSWGGQCDSSGWSGSYTNGFYSTPEAACMAILDFFPAAKTFHGVNHYSNYSVCDIRTSSGSQFSENHSLIYKSGDCSEPECPDGQHYENGQCVKTLQCPQGYKKEGDKCVWQCPAGYKDVGGSCVPDDQPEDCDPAIQECNDDGTPKCDPCSKLQEIINNGKTIINNDNRVISLAETLVSNQNTTNNNINNVSNNINNVNNTLNTINNNMHTVNTNIENIDNSVQELITTIQENNPTIDTTALENKIDEVINAINNNTGGGGGDDVPPDLQPIIDKMNELNQSIIDSKYDDTTLQAKLDEIINFDITPITDRQDEQIGLLEDIKRLLYPQNEAGDPSLDLPEAEQNEVDLWGAIKGFDINQNIINATAECPADKEFTINFGIKTATFAIPMSPMCQYLSYLAPIFLMLAYFSGAMIILKAGE